MAQIPELCRLRRLDQSILEAISGIVDFNDI